MAKANAWVIIAVIALVVIGMQAGWFTGIANIFKGGSSGGTTVVTSATTFGPVLIDALSPGTSVSGTNYVGVDGGSLKTGVTSVSGGQKLELLVSNGTTYHNAYVPTLTVPSATTFYPEVKLKGNATITMTVFNTNNVVMDADGAATNQTVASGGAYNLQIRLDGQDKKSTQDMVCILESNNNTAMDKMTLSGLGASYVGMSKPSSYSLLGSNSAIWVYSVPAIEGAVSPTGTIGIQSKAGKTLAGSEFKITCRTKEYFIDSITGKVVYDIEDSSGTAKSMATYSFADYFT